MRQTCALTYDDNLTVVASSSRWSVADHLLLPLHQPRLWREVAKKLADDLQKEVDARYAFYDAMSKDTEGLISL